MTRPFISVGMRAVGGVCLVIAVVFQVDADLILGNGIPNIAFDPVTGQLTVATDGADISSLLVEGPQALSIDRWLDGTMQDGVEWAHAFINGREQWVVTGGFGEGGEGAEFVPQGTYQIATYDANAVDILDFGVVDLATQNPPSTVTTTVDLASLIMLPGDFDGNGAVDHADLDLVLLNWGAPTPPLPEAWINDLPDSLIDQDELDRVLLGWGAGSLPFPSAATVPEPFSNLLTVVPVLFFASYLRRFWTCV